MNIEQLAKKHEWGVLSSDEAGMWDIDTGDGQVLRMVTDDYQMTCDLCGIHNASLLRFYSEAKERDMESFAPFFKHLEGVSNAELEARVLGSETPMHPCGTNAQMSDDALSPILERIEQRNEVYQMPDVPALIKALRYACERIGFMSDLWCGMNNMNGRNALADIASILAQGSEVHASDETKGIRVVAKRK